MCHLPTDMGSLRRGLLTLQQAKLIGLQVKLREQKRGEPNSCALFQQLRAFCCPPCLPKKSICTARFHVSCWLVAKHASDSMTWTWSLYAIKSACSLPACASHGDAAPAGSQNGGCNLHYLRFPVLGLNSNSFSGYRRSSFAYP